MRCSLLRHALMSNVTSPSCQHYPSTILSKSPSGPASAREAAGQPRPCLRPCASPPGTAADGLRNPAVLKQRVRPNLNGRQDVAVPSFGKVACTRRRSVGSFFLQSYWLQQCYLNPALSMDLSTKAPGLADTQPTHGSTGRER